jgi:hypothetical protein
MDLAINKPRVFVSNQLQQNFNKNGWVKFRLFSEDQIARIHKFYLSHQAAHEVIAEKKKFHATNETDNIELIKICDEYIKSVMLEEIGKHFVDCKMIAANYLVKQPAETSVLGPHQDLRFVDESYFYSFNIWVATSATNPQNGCLRFINGSHLWHDTVRALPSYPWKYESVAKELAGMLTDVETDIGECIVLNHACIHASYPNLSSSIRVAAILAMIPKRAEIIHYFLPCGNPANKVEEYKMTISDFLTLKVGQRPVSATLTNSFNYDFSPITDLEFKKITSTNEHSDKTPIDLYEKLKQKLSTLFRLS